MLYVLHSIISMSWLLSRIILDTEDTPHNFCLTKTKHIIFYSIKSFDDFELVCLSDYELN